MTDSTSFETIRVSVESESFEHVLESIVDGWGPKLVALTVGEDDPRIVDAWSSGSASPDGDQQQRLRRAHLVNQLLLTKDSQALIRAWLIGMNPLLGERSPASMLRDGRSDDVLVAAESHLRTGWAPSRVVATDTRYKLASADNRRAATSHGSDHFWSVRRLSSPRQRRGRVCPAQVREHAIPSYQGLLDAMHSLALSKSQRRPKTARPVASSGTPNPGRTGHFAN